MKSGMPSGIHPVIHKRLYSALPRPPVASSSQRPHRLRPRSNSASLHTNGHQLPLPFFDSPAAAPSSSRLSPTSPRIPAEPKQQTSHPNPLALTPSPPTDDGTSAHCQILFSNLPYPYSLHLTYDPHVNLSTVYPKHKRPRTRYQLDVGAYGIPKRNRHSFHTQASDSLHLAVQVGEDAYFARPNALGVADGVGGWARAKTPEPHPPSTPSPSALFARRLMHFTSAQFESPLDHPLTDPGSSDLESHLADLQEGIDILQILESAYESTVKAHIQPSTSTPLHTGSSTALVAALDNAEEPVLRIAHIGDCMGMLVRGNDIVWRSREMWWAFNTPVQLSPPPKPPTPPPPPLPSIFSPNPLTHASSTSSPRNPTSFHRMCPPPPPPRIQSLSSQTSLPEPAPLAGSSKVTPRNTAHVITLPVHADDILILASDGLSDNLWDEDVLDEVGRFRQLWPDGAKITDDEVADTSPRADESSGWKAFSAGRIQRYALAAKLSEALCSRARCVSEQRPAAPHQTATLDTPTATKAHRGNDSLGSGDFADETPFAHRAREVGKSFSGGKRDGGSGSNSIDLSLADDTASVDISVLVAIVSPMLI